MDVTKTIMFIVPSMRGGGSERVVSLLVQYLDRSNFDLILVLLNKEGPYLHDLPEDIKIVDLKSPRLRQAIFAIPKIIRAYKPDIVISTLSHLNMYIALIRPFLPKNIKFIARESSIASINNQNSSYSTLFDILYRSFFNRFDKIIAQSHYMKKDLIENYHINPTKIIVIHNPIDITKISTQAQTDTRLFDSDRYNLLSVGRLSREKGYDLLLQAMQELDQYFHLTIIGSGILEEELKQLVISLDISKKVTFLGFQSNPYKYMAQADLMVLCSRYEGFPNVVLEANACGTPVVAFDCPGGTGEIIEDGRNGLLVECGNTSELTKTIYVASATQWDKENIKQRAHTLYDLHTVMQKYQNEFLAGESQCI